MNLNKHVEFFNPENIEKFSVDINIIGVGAVGSWIAIQLAKLGIKKLILWDFDTVDDHNITNQAYTFKDIGMKKTDALEKHLLDINPDIKIEKVEKYTADSVVTGIVFLEVDTMKVRQEFVENNQYNTLIKYLIDGRIGLCDGQVYVVDWANDIKVSNYVTRVNAFNDDQTMVRVSACGTTLSVVPTVLETAGKAVASFINMINGTNPAFLIGFDSFEYKTGFSK